ncbi:hypothetical protein EK904_011743, partial [Melospiza melodia maxima]
MDCVPVVVPFDTTQLVWGTADKEWLTLVQHGTLLHFQICIQTLLVLDPKETGELLVCEHVLDIVAVKSGRSRWFGNRYKNVIGLVIGKTDVRSFPDRKSTVPLNSFYFIFFNG